MSTTTVPAARAGSGFAPRAVRIWRRRSGALALALGVGLSGCTAGGDGPQPVPATSAPGTTAPSRAGAQATVDELVRSARAGERTAFDSQVATRDPSFADRARLLYDNLAALPLDRVQLRLRAVTQPVTPARQQVLGADAWSQQADLSWRLVGETATAGATLWLTFVRDGDRVLLAGTIDAPPGTTSPEPIWWTGPVTAVRDGDLTVLVGPGQPADRWLARTRDAVRDVRRRLTLGGGHRWDGSAVVEVPASRAAFEEVVGAAPGSYAAVAAVTLAEGQTADAALRVVVNPDVTRTLSELGVDTVLTHEMVHRATRSADSPAPTWAVEGLADYVAFASHPGAAKGSEDLLRRQVRQHGAPTALPAAARFGADQAGLDLAYAQAWSACRYVALTWSPADLQRLYAGLDRGVGLDAAARDDLGVSAAALTAGWRRWLERQAG